MGMFERYIGIDYSGAKTPASSLKGLRVYAATGDTQPLEILPPPSVRTYWTRRGVAEWLRKILLEDVTTIVGIDHGFSFPIDYFVQHKVPLSWTEFLDDFHRHWPTDIDDVKVDFVRKGLIGSGACRYGNTRWRRLTERRAGAAKSVFHFDVQGSVAKSTHSGIPWLRYLRQHCGKQVHFWPFDGWQVTQGFSAIVEVYPALWNLSFPQEERSSDQHDAYAVCAWLQKSTQDCTLIQYLEPDLTDEERQLAAVEGWILGVGSQSSGRLHRIS